MSAAKEASARAPEPYTRPDLYDILFSDLDFDKFYYVGRARDAKGPVLDLCCGTGRLLLPILEAGVDADGVDLNEPMLERARAKAAAAGFHPRLVVGDMREFEMPRRYGAVFIPFNAFAHNLTPADQLATLQCCYRHLLPGGLFTFDTFRASPDMLAEPAGPMVLEREVVHPLGGHAVQIWDGRSFDVANSIQHSRMEIRELDEDGQPFQVHDFETDVRWVQPDEIEELARLAGFTDVRVFGGYAGEEVEDSSHWLVIAARRDREDRG